MDLADALDLEDALPRGAARLPVEVSLDVRLSLALGDLTRVEDTRSMVSVEQVREWCRHPDSQVVIKPVAIVPDGPAGPRWFAYPGSTDPERSSPVSKKRSR